MLFAQVPHAEDAIRAAVDTGRYEPVVLVVIMLAVISFLVYLVRAVMIQASEREARLAKRIDTLEDFIRTELMAAMSENTKAMLTMSVTSAENAKAVTSLIEALHTTRICFSTGEQQAKLVESIANKVTASIQRNHGGET